MCVGVWFVLCFECCGGGIDSGIYIGFVSESDIWGKEGVVFGVVDFEFFWVFGVDELGDIDEWWFWYN